MKKVILPFFALIMMSSTLDGQFVEEFRSERMRRPPAGLVAQIDGYLPPRDINGNGSPDIIFNRNDSLTVMDGMTRQVILQWNFLNGWPVVLDEFYVRQPGTGYEEIKVTVIVSYSLDKSSPSIILQEIETGGATYSYPNYRFIGIADFDRGGKPEILAYDVANQQTVILGYQNADLNNGSPEEEIKISPLGHAYNLKLKYQSRSKQFLLRRGLPKQTQKLHDLTGDGNAEFVLLHEDDNGDIQGISVYDAISRSQLWSYQYDQSHLIDLQTGFRGFYDINGDGENEAFFGNRTVVTMDQMTHIVDEDFEALMIIDIDDDGFEDLIGRNLRDSTIQIWGKSTSTSTTSEQVKPVSIFPNPSKEQISFAFEHSESGNFHAEIFNASGVLVDHINLDEGNAGHLSNTHDISDLPSGLYVIRIQGIDQMHIGHFVKQ